MGETPVFMRKGYFFQRMDQLSRNEKQRDEFLIALNDLKRDYVDILREFNLLEPNKPEESEYPNKHEAHLRKHWFPKDPSRSGVWWQEWQPIEPIMREGYARAFEEAQKRRWPIDGYWVSIGTRVAVGIGVNEEEQKITLIRLTPPCPNYAPDASVIAVVESKGIKPGHEDSEITTTFRPQPIWRGLIAEGKPARRQGFA
jgi:hypothetical protein